MKLLAKLGASFGLVIAIMAVLSLYVIFGLAEVKSGGDIVANHYMPEVRGTVAVEHLVFTAVNEMNEYAETRDSRLWYGVLDKLQEASEYLQKASAITEDSTVLAELTPSLVIAKDALSAYALACEMTHKSMQKMSKAFDHMDNAANIFNAVLNVYVSAQEYMTLRDAEQRTSDLNFPIERLIRASNVMQLSKELRFQFINALSQDKPDEAQEAMNSFLSVIATMEILAEEIRNIGLKELLSEAIAAAKRFQEHGCTYVEQWRERHRANTERSIQQNKLIFATRSVSTLGIDKTMALSDKSAKISSQLALHLQVGLLAAVLLAAAFAVLLTRSVVARLQKGVAFAADIAAGHLDSSLEITSKDEMGELGMALNSMAATLRQRMEELAFATTEAVRANAAKSGFLANMSHEIRTPMNAILGITEIQLQKDALDQGMRAVFEKIYTSGDMLLAIINDILDLSKIESGKLELEPAQYEIASLISDTAQLNMMRIGSKPIEFELQVDENTPTHMLGDELRVKQILNNLLSNAFKYTDAGMVTLSIAAEPGSDADSVVLLINISDTGQGMTEEQLGQLFEEYARFNTEANRTTEGAGLGMSITRNLVRMMNGGISVTSEPGKGSVFSVNLPQGKVGSAVLGRAIAENLRQFRTQSRTQMQRVQITREPMPYGSIMIVDDVEINIYVATGLLAPYGLNIDTVDSGFAAIEKIKSGMTYDIIFMDHMMPQMDGIEATKIIRDMGYEHPIVALTADAVIGQAEIFLANGFDDFISKPIDVRQMNAVLNKLVRDKQPPEVIEAARRQAEAQKGQPSEDAL